MIMPARWIVVLCALSSGFLTSFVRAEIPANPAALEAACKLSVARNGDEVVVSWALPQVAIKGLDIYRNIQERSAGRTRLDFVHAEPAVYLDKVPAPKAVYWYWIKVVCSDGRIINVGPVATPAADVWTP